jgi:replicative DNA helicase
VISQHRHELLKKTGASRALIVVDYLQLLDVPDASPTSLDADYRRVGLLQNVGDAGKSPSRPLVDPVLAISEVRKEGRTGTAVDLLGSSRLAYAADAVLLLNPAEGGDAPGADTVPVTLTIAKGRDGTVRKEIPLLFEHARYRFRERGGDQGNRGQPARTPPRMKDPLAGSEE